MNWQNISNDLYTVFLKDDSELAYTECANIISDFFQANEGILFYKNAKAMCKICLSKSGYPISVPEDKWESFIPRNAKSNKLYAITHWDPPIIDDIRSSWFFFKINTDNEMPFYFFLGYETEAKKITKEQDTDAIINIISKIISLRINRDKDIQKNRDTEDKYKLIQTRMSAFFETLHNTIYSINDKGEFTSINKAGLELFGVGSQDEILGAKFTDFTNGENSHSFFLKQIHQNGFIDDHEIVIRKKNNGQQIYCLESAHSILSADGNIIEIQGIIKDITERIKNERDLCR